MNKEDFESETLDFFAQAHNGKVTKYRLEKEFEDENVKQYIAKVDTSIENYWVVGNENLALVVYAEISGKTAEEIYEFHKQEMKESTEDLKDEEEDAIIYGEANLSKEFLTAIGRLTINFAHLEFMLSLFCGSHMGVSNPINEIITSELSFKQLLNISSSIYRYIVNDQKYLDTFAELIKEAFRVEEMRNVIIHSSYGGHTKQQLIIRQKSTAKAKRGFKMDRQEITHTEIDELANAINELSKKFGLLIYTLASNEPAAK